MPEWLPWLPLVSIVIGLISGWVGAYMGLRMGVAKLEWNSQDMALKLDKLAKRSEAYNEDLLIHDLELEDVMRNLQLPRKKRQNWRFDT